MTFLLDVNTLLAYGLEGHVFHRRAAVWVQAEARNAATFATCAMTELGFVRILSQVSAYGITVAGAKELLGKLKADPALRIIFIVDDVGAESLPTWVKRPKQVTDGHLLQLARQNGARLATLDRALPGAFVVPE